MFNLLFTACVVGESCLTCRFFLQTLTAAKASCICFLRASLWRLYAISIKMRKIPAAMPPATSMKTPVNERDEGDCQTINGDTVLFESTHRGAGGDGASV